MTNFEKITASPETLGEFLASLPVATGPWDEAFHRTFCDGCQAEDCDGQDCPHKVERGNPLWWLNQTAAGEQKVRSYVWAWRDGRVTLEPGMIVSPQEKGPAMDGMCLEFNVYLNGKGPDGEALHGVEKVILPKASVYESGRVKPMNMKLTFRRSEDAVEVVKKMGQRCKLEIRAAVQCLERDGNWNYHGYSYVLEAMPMEIEPEPLERNGGTGLTVWFMVYHYTANANDKKLLNCSFVKKEETEWN